jgi:hypothetical protein
MCEQQSAPALRLVIPLPVALYSSNGLLFELYEGGQPCRRHRVVWERVRTIEERSSTGTPADQVHD